MAEKERRKTQGCVTSMPTKIMHIAPKK